MTFDDVCSRLVAANHRSFIGQERWLPETGFLELLEANEERSFHARVGTSGRLYLCTINSEAAHFARKPARAFFPSLVASAMVSKKVADRFTGPDRPAR